MWKGVRSRGRGVLWGLGGEGERGDTGMEASCLELVGEGRLDRAYVRSHNGL